MEYPVIRCQYTVTEGDKSIGICMEPCVTYIVPGPEENDSFWGFGVCSQHLLTFREDAEDWKTDYEELSYEEFIVHEVMMS
jgi:hypothetical protein